MKKFLQSRKHLACMLKAVTLLTLPACCSRGLVPIPQLVHYVAQFYPDYAGFASAAVWYVIWDFCHFMGHWY